MLQSRKVMTAAKVHLSRIYAVEKRERDRPGRFQLASRRLALAAKLFVFQ